MLQDLSNFKRKHFKTSFVVLMQSICACPWGLTLQSNSFYLKMIASGKFALVERIFAQIAQIKPQLKENGLSYNKRRK